MSHDRNVDPGAPGERFRFSPEQRARLARTSEEQVVARAAADVDNPPPSDDMMDRMSASRMARLARERTGMSQTAFAERFRIGLGRLRDLEQGRWRADGALLAYLTVIEADPDAVMRALDRSDAA